MFLFGHWLLSSTIVSATCFNSKGDAWAFVEEDPIEAWVPCNTSSSITNCCGPRDYCMDNGLCLDAVVDNMISQQGCTDRNWSPPCANYCSGQQSSTAGLLFLWRCDFQTHCCGNNSHTTCCEDAGVKMFTLDVGIAINRPGFSVTSVSTTATTSPTSPGQTATSATQDAAAAPTGAGTGEASGSGSNSRELGIALGLGIPLGLGVIAALTFFALRRKRRHGHEQRLGEVPGQAYHSPHYHETIGPTYTPSATNQPRYNYSQNQYPFGSLNGPYSTQQHISELDSTKTSELASTRH
ncbi:hypothetical protein F4778DRAFT_776782 [Xylariomycetidae sp. FL2044]|nr:hypothetical protein F4778DRAFT_776782 [Xylariomycetidae sp. FL2044]